MDDKIHYILRTINGDWCAVEFERDFPTAAVYALNDAQFKQFMDEEDIEAATEGDDPLIILYYDEESQSVIAEADYGYVIGASRERTGPGGIDWGDDDTWQMM